MLFLYPGTYKNFDDLELHLTRDELIIMYKRANEIRMDDKRFTAALKGIDLDEGKITEFDEVKRRAEATAAGMSEEEYELDGMLNMEVDEDWDE